MIVHKVENDRTHFMNRIILAHNAVVHFSCLKAIDYFRCTRRRYTINKGNNVNVRRINKEVLSKLYAPTDKPAHAVPQIRNLHISVLYNILRSQVQVQCLPLN